MPYAVMKNRAAATRLTISRWKNASAGKNPAAHGGDAVEARGASPGVRTLQKIPAALAATLISAAGAGHDSPA